MTYIFVIGDSNTYGAWDLEGGWVQRLRKFLDQKVIDNPDKDFFMTYNLGIDGHSTRDWLPIFENVKKTLTKNKLI